MGVLSLSFLFGDAAGRLWLGALVSHGAGWRAVFVAIAIVCAVTLGRSPHLGWSVVSRLQAAVAVASMMACAAFWLRPVSDTSRTQVGVESELSLT